MRDSLLTAVYPRVREKARDHQQTAFLQGFAAPLPRGNPA